MELMDRVTSVKGIGEKTAESLGKLGIYTIRDLIHYYPRTYITYAEPVALQDIAADERQAVAVTINSRVEVRKVRGYSIAVVYAKDYTGTIKLTWFNCPFLRNFFHIGDKYIFVGEIKYKNGMYTMTQPEYFTPEKYKDVIKVWQPVYVCTAGITSKTIQKAVKGAVPLIDRLTDYLPADIRAEYDLMDVCSAVKYIHFPDCEQNLKLAMKRVAFDEFYEFIVHMHRLKKQDITKENKMQIAWNPLVTEFIEGLSYRLTNAQMDAVRDIMGDMESEHVMNRLIQGDVGSGKTIVAAIALFACAVSGYQGVIMAPTEVLANQHFKELSSLFEKYGIRTALLTGSMTAKEKRQTYQEIAEHQVDVIVGTHALIQDKVEYDNLALVVTDEQHRFGVRQREKLSKKGGTPHVLVMSATPIPRTLAIIMYGDLDITVIHELPAGRIPIKNCVVDESYRPKAHAFLLSEVRKGHQVYVVCPMVEESEALEDVANVVSYAEDLSEKLCGEASVAYLHGKMSGDEKNQILTEFYEKKIDILVSTTVIEVGINNPNATVMMVENAERFGLAALHQLRGRVGRGNLQSYCIFISGKKSKEVMERLNVLADSNDGFYIAGEDLKRRGPGDFFGIRQSGDLLFKMGDIYKHADMLKAASDVYERYGDRVQPSFDRSISTGNDLYGKPVL